MVAAATIDISNNGGVDLPENLPVESHLTLERDSGATLISSHSSQRHKGRFTINRLFHTTPSGLLYWDYEDWDFHKCNFSIAHNV